MIIKKFQGKTEAEAVETAKKELGNNVVVMNVRNIKKKGIFSFLSPQLMEVTVALEEENERYGAGNVRKDDKSEPFFTAPFANNINAAANDDLKDFDFESIIRNGVAEQSGDRSNFKAKQEMFSDSNDTIGRENVYRSGGSNGSSDRNPGGNAGVSGNNNGAINNRNRSNNGNITNNGSVNINATNNQRSNVINDQRTSNKLNSGLEEKLDSLHSLLEQQLQKPEEDKKVIEEAAQPDDELHVFMKLLYGTMLDNEIKEKYANHIIDELEKTNKPNMPFDYALSNIYQKMILKFGKPAIIQPAKNGPKVVFFVGPTGVGKTTTIAKIASRFRVEEHKKVALLTADTYRIAAAEQLRTYANILEVPFRVIYTKEEIEQAMSDYRGFDFVLVDTAGHSHQNETQRENMKAFIHSVDAMVEKEVFLVLSATTKYRDLVSIADSYKEITDFKLIFTKLDETTTLGNLLNLKLYTGAALSYMTYGQNVPDDIEDFNPQKTVKQLLGGRK
ncbi:MAG: flagellar biosynthesis protein FlhF [Lachnospiraceae bacterium]|jgi:flagellar biosynthesis protein FlhF|nr:flagellar biosynthesis protein FlhF [Lachnospiraceae bacterium]